MKKLIFSLVILAGSAGAVFALNSFSNEHAEGAAATEQVHSHSHADGKNCRYTVGCDCRGFSPCGGDVWKHAYCKHCGHHRQYHR